MIKLSFSIKEGVIINNLISPTKVHIRRKKGNMRSDDQSMGKLNFSFSIPIHLPNYINLFLPTIFFFKAFLLYRELFLSLLLSLCLSPFPYFLVSLSSKIHFIKAASTSGLQKKFQLLFSLSWFFKDSYILRILFLFYIFLISKALN